MEAKFSLVNVQNYQVLSSERGDRKWNEEQLNKGQLGKGKMACTKAESLR